MANYTSTKYKKFVLGAASAALVATAVAPVASAKDFQDTKGNTHETAIDALSDAGVITGYPDGTFLPNKTLTRSDVVKLMGKWLVTEGYEIPTDYKTNMRFTDLTSKSNDELLQYAAVVKDNGVFKGSNGNLLAGDNITRENMAVVLVRAFDEVKDMELVTYVAAQDFEKDVTDLGKGKAEARPAIDVLDYFDITNPAAPVFNPKNTTTRGQFATFLYKTINTDFSAVQEYEVNEDLVAVKAAAEQVKAGAVTVSRGVDATDANKLAAVQTYVTSLVTEKDVVATVVAGKTAGDYVVTLTKGEEKVEKTIAVTFDFAADDRFVTEVKALNSTELQLTFSQALDKKSAETIANYAVTANAPSAEKAKKIQDIQLQADGKSVIIRFADVLVKNTVYTVDVSTVLTASFHKVDKFNGTVSISTDAAPSLVSASFDGKLNLTFNEEVDLSKAIVRVDGVQYNDFAAVDAEAGTYTYVATTTGIAATNGAHAVTIVGAKDKAGNEASTLTASYTVSEDITAPTVASIEKVTATTFKLVFSEAVTQPTVKTVKGATEFEAKVVSQTGLQKEWLVNVETKAGSNDLFNKDESTVSLSVEVTKYKDRVNLLGSKYTGAVSLTRNTEVPTVVSTNLNTVVAKGTGTVITIPFSESITAGTGVITVKDPDGIIQTATRGYADKNLTLTISGKAPKEGTYTITLAANAVKDADLNGNLSATTSVNFSTVATNQELATSAVAVNTAIINGKVVNYIDIAYGTNDMANSAIELANYKLDNSELPAGTTIGFVGNKQSVRITLPTNFEVPAKAGYKFEISKNVKTIAGSTIVATDKLTTFTKQITLNDTKAPQLVSAKLVNADQVELTFSEVLAAVADDLNHINDLVVKVNGSIVVPTAILDGVKGDNKVVVTIPTFNATQTVTIEVVSDSLTIKDVSGNVVVAGATVTAKK